MAVSTGNNKSEGEIYYGTTNNENFRINTDCINGSINLYFRTNVDHIAIYTSTDSFTNLVIICSNGYWDETWNDQLSCIPSDRSSRTSSIFRI